MSQFLLVLFSSFILLQVIVVSSYLVSAGTFGETRDYADINGTQYFFSPHGLIMTARDAAVFCNYLNMSLVGLETQEEIDLVKNYMTANGLDGMMFWTSGHGYYNTWIWANSGIVFFAEDDVWLFDHPAEGSDCAAIKSPNNKLYSLICGNSYHFICEER